MTRGGYQTRALLGASPEPGYDRQFLIPNLFQLRRTDSVMRRTMRELIHLP